MVTKTSDCCYRAVIKSLELENTFIIKNQWSQVCCTRGLCLSNASVKKWAAEFKRDRQSLEDHLVAVSLAKRLPQPMSMLWESVWSNTGFLVLAW